MVGVAWTPNCYEQCLLREPSPLRTRTLLLSWTIYLAATLVFSMNGKIQRIVAWKWVRLKHRVVMLQLGAKSSIEINIFKFPTFSAYSPDPNRIRLIGKISSYSPVRPTPYRQRYKKKSIPTVKIIPTVEGVFLNEVRGNRLALNMTSQSQCLLTLCKSCPVRFWREGRGLEVLDDFWALVFELF